MRRRRRDVVQGVGGGDELPAELPGGPAARRHDDHRRDHRAHPALQRPAVPHRGVLPREGGRGDLHVRRQEAPLHRVHRRVLVQGPGRGPDGWQAGQQLRGRQRGTLRGGRGQHPVCQHRSGSHALLGEPDGGCQDEAHASNRIRLRRARGCGRRVWVEESGEPRCLRGRGPAGHWRPRRPRLRQQGLEGVREHLHLRATTELRHLRGQLRDGAHHRQQPDGGAPARRRCQPVDGDSRVQGRQHRGRSIPSRRVRDRRRSVQQEHGSAGPHHGRVARAYELRSDP
mmetsp:Transcript_60861/g.173061  ORF Transcript_60861/g.173061 Transcript_60861/m.173061 type:complete len:285 (-) Transcript_60861:5143-5997(-)